MDPKQVLKFAETQKKKITAENIYASICVCVYVFVFFWCVCVSVCVYVYVCVDITFFFSFLHIFTPTPLFFWASAQKTKNNCFIHFKSLFFFWDSQILEF